VIKQKIIVSFFFFGNQIFRIHFINNSGRLLLLCNQLRNMIRVNYVFSSNAHIVTSSSCNFFHYCRINICHSVRSSQNNVIILIIYHCMNIIPHKGTWIKRHIQSYKKCYTHSKYQYCLYDFLKIVHK